jgi:DNA-binding NarL/FixJ family response regulator
VVIADDHTVVRSGVRLLLEAESDIEVVGEAKDGHEALALMESSHPDVVYGHCDAQMDGPNHSPDCTAGLTLMYWSTIPHG